MVRVCEGCGGWQGFRVIEIYSGFKENPSVPLMRVMQRAAELLSDTHRPLSSNL